MGIDDLSLLHCVALTLATSSGAYWWIKRYESDPGAELPLSILLVYAPLLLSLPLINHIPNVAVALLAIFGSYFSLILLYTTVYRLSPFHPLARYPGPFPAKLSKFWAIHVARSGKEHLYLKALHERYGDFVRIGPNELLIRDPTAIDSILGSDGLPKGPWWDNRPHDPAGAPLVGIRNTVEHSRRRKLWSRAFANQALKDYEEPAAKASKQLVERIQRMVQQREGGGNGQGALLDLAAWMTYFATDFMGTIVFGDNFGLVEDGGDSNGVLQLLKSGQDGIAIFAHVSWTLMFHKIFPSVRETAVLMQKFVVKNVKSRVAIGVGKKDLFYHLRDEEQLEKIRPSLAELTSDSILAVRAGSDKTALVLTALFYYLLRHPSAYKRLQDEVDSVFQRGEEPVDSAKLSEMAWLNACINETVRLQPPIADGTQRMVVRGSGPKVLGENVIPEQTTVFVHTYSIHRDPRNFSSPDSFLPERWLGTDAAITAHNLTAFFPFSYGPYNCVGKNLALLEIRMAVASLVQKFNFQPESEGKKPGVETWEGGLRDFYVLRKGPLWVEVVSRK
ncbi:high nitrogen upregulated cytochrome P450 monooxygenase 2 [Artomyces pyxidatus]|uniref:High nitrogen upregulated cytochrome P450 monooxygenase 2 n=1 Tax=Artomyces pyxidatus TaxID=48021 RepID=A0ACB8THA1_9AGAM|nr:high nitrogen upregulated cytochrome P450 monooxygenase 2 [Artomyces pyxidatus]